MSLYVPGHTPSWKQGFARNAAESAAPGLWKGLAGLWAPGLGPTGLTLRDLSGFGNHGTLTNMDPATDWGTTGQRGIPRALDFGNHDSMESVVVPRNQFPYLAQLTVSAWVNVSNNSSLGIKGVMADWGVSGDASWLLGVDIGSGFNPIKLTAQIHDGSTTDTFAPVADIDARFKWRQIAMTYDGTTLKVWLDGREWGSTGSVLVLDDTGNDIVMGNSTASSNTQGLPGMATDFSIWNRVLLPSEIQQLHEDPMARFRRRVQVFPTAVVAAVGNRKQYVLGGGIVA